MNETKTEWRDCADPDELAAAVAAGVEVEVQRRVGQPWQPTRSIDAAQFAGFISTGHRYRLPTSWRPEPPAPDDLAARARRHADTHPESRELIEGLLGAWGQLADRAAEAQAAAWDQRLNWTGKWPTPPDGCEVVWLPSDVVDEWVGLPTTDYPPSLGQARATIYACREAQARRGTTPTPDAEPMIVDDWSNDEQMAEECGCSHTLGQHEYGAAIATCEVCGCNDFHSPSSCRARTARPNGCPYDGIGRPPWEAPTPPPAPDEVAAPDDDWCEAVLNDLNSIIHGHCGSDGSDDAHCDWVNDLANEVVRYFQRQDVLAVLPTPPAPPWPGAVLSGLVDEDGEPTWLALAPNVLGEAVRTCVDFPWFICGSDNAVTPYWVEVRAPRAVPEPETERVPVLDAIRDRIELTHPEGEFLAVGVELREDGDLVAIEQQEPWGKAQPVAPDGTVEVLRDGGR